MTALAVQRGSYITRLLIAGLAVALTAGPPHMLTLVNGGQPNDTEREMILSMHNEARMNVDPPRKGGPMDPLVWDDRLAQEAEEWSQSCQYHVSDIRLRPGHGENMVPLIGGPSPKWRDAIQVFLDEKEFFFIEIFACRILKNCDRYTQVIEQQSKSFGCGYTACDTVQYFWEHPGPAVFYVCHYGTEQCPLIPPYPYALN